MQTETHVGVTFTLNGDPCHQVAIKSTLPATPANPFVFSYSTDNSGIVSIGQETFPFDNPGSPQCNLGVTLLGSGCSGSATNVMLAPGSLTANSNIYDGYSETVCLSATGALPSSVDYDGFVVT